MSVRKVCVALVSAAVLVTLMNAPLRADTLTIFNTGVDNNGLLLPAGSLDPHYTVWTSAAGVLDLVTTFNPTGQGIVLSPGNLLPTMGSVPGYVPNDSASQWISSNDSIANLGGFQYYETTFTVTGNNLAMDTLQGSYAGKDILLGVWLNSNPLTASPLPNTSFTSSEDPWSSLHPFTANESSGLVTGENTLYFGVFGLSPAYNGLRTEFNPSLNNVPAPGLPTILLGLAMASPAYLFRRKRPAG